VYEPSRLELVTLLRCAKRAKPLMCANDACQSAPQAPVSLSTSCRPEMYFEILSPDSSRNEIVDRPPTWALTPPYWRVPSLRGIWYPAACAALGSRF
jgi:hypothetical protein